MLRRRCCLLLVGTMAAVAASASARGGLPEVPAEVMPLAARSLLLDVARSGAIVIAVGERGHILVSRDGGGTFRQVVAPVRSTLTAVATAGEAAFAVGHDGVILKSRDEGRSWDLVFSAPEEERPLLDVLPLGEEDVLAVGAYGWVLRSEDGGSTWAADTIDPDEPHLNALAEASDGTLLAAAEFGLAFRSTDRGRTFDRLELPYEGSLFGALAVRGAWLAFGLRGRVFRSRDHETFERIEAGTLATLLTGVVLRDGRVVLAGLSGVLLVSEDAGRTFVAIQDPDRLGISGLAELADGVLLLAGEGGLRRMADVSDPTTIVPIPAGGGS